MFLDPSGSINWLVPSCGGDLAGEKSWESNYLVFLDPSSFLFWSSLGEYSALKAALKVSSLSHIYIIIGKYREVLGYPTRLGGTRLPDPYLGGTRLPDPYWGGTAASP